MRKIIFHFFWLILELEKYVFLRIGKTEKFQKLRNVRIFSNLNHTYRKNLKNPDSLDFLGFLHTHFYVIPIRIFTDIKYVFLRI